MKQALKSKSIFNSSKIKLFIFGENFLNYESLNLARKILIPILSMFFTYWALLSVAIFSPLYQRTTTERVLYLLVFLVCSVFMMRLFLLLMNKQVVHTMRKKSVPILLVYMIFSVLLMVHIYYVSLPVGVSPDVNDQMKMVSTNVYYDWHPFMHTILFYKIPMDLFGNNVESVAIFQYVYVGLILGYTGYSMYRFGCKHTTFIIVVSITILNKYFRAIIDYPWKDTPYSFGILLMTVCCMWIYFTKGEWLKKKWNVVLFVISCLLVLFMRHNGILSYGALMVMLIIFYKQYRKLLSILFVAITVFYFVFTGPIYNILGVQKHSESFAEMTGVLNNQIAYVVVNEHDMTEEELEFVNNIVPIEVIEDTYKVGNFNNSKWKKDENGIAYYNGQFIEDNKQEYLQTWFSIFKKNTRLSVQAYYFTIKPIIRWHIDLEKKFFISTGFIFFLAMFTIAVSAVKNFKRVIPSIPMFINMLGIMLLITGGELRFVFANLTTGLFLVVFSFIYVDNEKVEVIKE